MSAQTIYAQLRQNGMSHAGACGMLGNMYAESTLQSNICQRGMTSLTDIEYTAKWDADPEYGVNGRVGYGLCQWTYPTRQRNLRSFCGSLGRSVGDEYAQVQFCITELQSEYSGLWSFLCSTDDMYSATSKICKEYERPAVNNIDTRYGFAQSYDGLRGYNYDDYQHSGEIAPNVSSISVDGINHVMTLQAWLTDNGIDVGEIDGIPGEKLRNGLKQLLERF